MDNIPTQNVRFHYFDGQVMDEQISDELSNYSTRQTEGSEDHHRFASEKGMPRETITSTMTK